MNSIVKKKYLGVSFIIPAYNCADTITESIESIFNGNFSHGDEVIIVDDAPTDGTFKIIKNLQKKYPAINIFSHNYNKGSAGAGRNTGIDNSKNDLIFCLDADNILSPNSVSKLKKYMLSKNADAAAFRELRYFKDNVKNVTHKWIFKDEISLTDCLSDAKFPGASGNYLFTKQSWLKASRYNESVGGAYDSWVFGFCQLASGAKMVTMPNSFYYHRYGHESAFIRDSKKKSSSIVILQGILPFIDVICDKDVDYIMSPRAKCKWFENLKKHPIRLKNKRSKKMQRNIHLPTRKSFLTFVKNILKSLIKI